MITRWGILQETDRTDLMASRGKRKREGEKRVNNGVLEIRELSDEFSLKLKQ